MQQLLDEILFEHRNKEYGSYKLRKGYFSRLAISFAISVTVITVLVLVYYFYLNTGGDDTVYLYSSGNPGMKSTQGSVMDPADLSAYLNQHDDLKVQPDKITQPAQDPLRDFKVTKDPAPDTFKQTTEEKPESTESAGLGTSTDSTVFGGYLIGEGEGSGSGNGLDKFPEFPGGTDAVRRYIELTVIYPLQAIKQKLNGVVVVSFDVNKLGEVDNIQIERGVNPMLDQEAVKAVKSMPRWKPGVRHGRPVIVKFVIPVRFMPIS
jgi:periplasmic protein TonB